MSFVSVHVGAATLQNQSVFFDGILVSYSSANLCLLIIALQTEGFVKDDAGAFWIDRDPSVFELVLGYLRYGSLPSNASF